MDKGEDVQAKYLRLGQEYQKARAQVTVLKKAVIDEQSTTKTLQEAIKQRDQSIRKYEQDIDSLQFRNSQLSKRVEILQGELDKYEKRGTKPGKQSSSQNNSSVNFVHEQELQLKISENESLHKQLQEANQQSQMVVQGLEMRLEILEKDKESYEKAIEDCNSKNDSIVDRMKEEQHSLDVQLHKLKEELKISNIMAGKYKQQLQGVSEELKSKLDKTAKLMHEKMALQDTENEDLNELNLPVCDRTHQHKAQLFMEVITNQFIVFIATMSDYQTYLEQRVRVYSTDMKQEESSTATKKFCTHLLANAAYTRKVQHALTALQKQVQNEIFVSMDNLPVLKTFLTSFKTYVKYLQKLWPYRVISLDEECHSSTWSESLEKCNKKLIKEEGKVVALFQRLLTYLTVVTNKCHSSSLPTCLINLCTTLQKLSHSFKALFTIHSERITEEHNFPTYTQRLKTTDDCLISTLHSLENVSAKIHHIFKDNLEFMTNNHVFKRKGLPTDTQKLHGDMKYLFSKASSYMSSIQSEKSSSVPYEYAVKNYRVMLTSNRQSNSYAKQAANAQESIVKLEQEKEHWMLEAQLVTAKYDKEAKKTMLLGEELKKCKIEMLSRSNDIEDNMCASDNPVMNQDRSRSTRSITSSISSMPDTPTQPFPVGTLEIFPKDNKNNKTSMESDHDNLVKDHFTSRVSQLTKQLQMSDSIAINFYHEAHSLYKQMILADKTKKKLSNEIVESNKKFESLQDELETTKKSYEEQLQMLTDHLCGMNEKLTAQKDEIDGLKTSSSSSNKRFARKK